VIVANKPLPSYQVPQRKDSPAIPAKKARPKQNNKPLLRLCLVLAAVVFLSFTLVARQTQIVSANRNLTRLQDDIAALEAANAALQRDVASLSSSSRIEDIARTKLGMQRPTDNQIMKVGVSSGN